MAGGQGIRLAGLVTKLLNVTKRTHLTVGSLASARPMSTTTGSSYEDANCKVEIGLTPDGKTIVCYHPAVEFPYELSQPIPRPDPLSNPAETHDQVLKAHLSMEVPQNKAGPTIEELSKMFFTTKHRWYPYGQYHRRRKKLNPPKDR
ncbi:large ribosomal subunit protein mL42 [Paramormyrops kingsleyae]|uniref:Large ribosomal subunit protein mL42 n=1 Tax=Paramormyrops kingsleyae TaxID=1676925 RepID=A0A3B3QYE1_9TELE|nr:39S ribosomal protein L42, mitochondrial [Paramormyrops kingsleyae]